MADFTGRVLSFVRVRTEEQLAAKSLELNLTFHQAHEWVAIYLRGNFIIAWYYKNLDKAHMAQGLIAPAEPQKKPQRSKPNRGR